MVVFDPQRDLAVLYVPDLSRRRARLRRRAVAAATRPSSPASRGGGPFRLEPARIRDTIEARGPDIYHRNQVTREVFSLYADVEPGNSGGPLLTPEGDVYGVVFAKSLDDPETGYALTADEVAPVVTGSKGARPRRRPSPAPDRARISQHWIALGPPGG